MALKVKYDADQFILTRIYHQTQFALKPNLGKNRPEPKWIEKTSNGFLFLLKQPFKVVNHLVESFRDPRVVTISVTASALLANSWLFYSKETVSNIRHLSQYIITKLPKILKHYIPKQLQWTPRFTAFIYTSAFITALGIRALGRFSDEDLCSIYYGNNTPRVINDNDVDGYDG